MPDGRDAGGAPGDGSGEPSIVRLHEQIGRLERRLETVLGPAAHVAGEAGRRIGHEIDTVLVPAWRRANRGESRWPVTVAVVVAIALQVALPERLTLLHTWLLPSVEAVLLIVIVAANPRRITHRSMWIRATGLALIALASLANAWSAAMLVRGLVRGTEGESAGPLLVTGGLIWLTNVIIFGLWYWEFDRGGPAARARGERANSPDFMFPQMATPGVADPNWAPEFVDYLYVSFTNAAAFSPTDTMPLSRWAKLAMLLQSGVSLMTVALVIARAVNILK